MDYKSISIFLQFTFVFYFGSFKGITWHIPHQRAGIVSLYKQDVFVKHNAPDNGQFQRRPRSQGQIL